MKTERRFRLMPRRSSGADHFGGGLRRATARPWRELTARRVIAAMSAPAGAAAPAAPVPLVEIPMFGVPAAAAAPLSTLRGIWLRAAISRTAPTVNGGGRVAP